MDTCPYCEKEVPGAAILCPHCRRVLRVQSTARKRKATSPVRRSTWRQGAQSAAMLTALTAGAAVGLAESRLELAGGLLFGAPVSFLVFWPLCTYIAWLRRQAMKRTTASKGRSLG